MIAAIRVVDWIWRDGRYVSPAAAVGPDRADRLESLEGHFALHRRLKDGSHVLARDPLGVNKLFFTVDADGDVVSHNFLAALRARGVPAERIYSVPSGHQVRIAPARRQYRLEAGRPLCFAGRDPGPRDSLTGHGARIRAALNATFGRLREALAGRRVFVTLSGGLDSTVIAVLAQQMLADVARLSAVTFCLGRPHLQPRGSDLDSALRVAEALDLPLSVVALDPEEVTDLLDAVLLYGQDYRDFNVHCGVVNAALARGLVQRRLREAEDDAQPSGARLTAQRPVILTGDTMNELMADYSTERYRGVQYYALPRMAPTRLRRALVEGLDSGDREVGIFARYGFDTIQPYALCAQAYAALPGAYLEQAQAKQALVWHTMGDEVPAHVYARPKVRAQLASVRGDGGVLAALVNRGYDSARLAERYGELLDLAPRELKGLLRAGHYRFAATYPFDSTQKEEACA